jgi:hypothetical protein
MLRVMGRHGPNGTCLEAYAAHPVRRYSAVAAACMTSVPDPSSSFTAAKFSREITITPSREKISASREISDGEGSRRRHADDSGATWNRETEVWSARGQRRTVGEGYK